MPTKSSDRTGTNELRRFFVVMTDKDEPTGLGDYIYQLAGSDDGIRLREIKKLARQLRALARRVEKMTDE